MTSDVDFKPTRVQRPREQIEAQIREAILSGVFGQGDKLPSETALAEQFGVSRTTIREALRSLASARLIHKLPGVGGGSFVQTVDHHSLSSALADSLENIVRLGSITSAEVHELRRLLELPAAGLAATHRTEAQLATLRAVLDREKHATVVDPHVSDLDISFHSAIGEASGNRALAAFVGALHRVARPVDHMALSVDAGKATVRQHRALIKAISDQDAAAAMHAMANHLDYVAKLNDMLPSRLGTIGQQMPAMNASARP
jgi:DNA-binding FadR family transcriptional regulator